MSAATANSPNYSPATRNLYAYVENNPVTTTDPDGHTAFSSLMSAGYGGTAICGIDNTDTDCGDPTSGGSGVVESNDYGAPGMPASVQYLPNALPDFQPDPNAEVPAEVREAVRSSVVASDSPDSDDKAGGYHEEGGVWGTAANGSLIVSPDLPGPYSGPGQAVADIQITPANPSLNNSIVNVGGIWHVHPRGGDGQAYFQPPSPYDMVHASSAINFVVGAGSKRVYFYDSTGVIQQISLKIFLRGY